MARLLRRLDASMGLAVEDGAKIMLLLFLSMAVVICFVYQVLALSHRYPLDYGEAPLVDQALRLAAGQNIYRANLATPPYTISNYPPLYVAALVPFLQLSDSSFFWGRLISVLCAWASAFFLALVVHAQTRDRLAGVLTGLVFLAFPFVVHWSSLLRIDLLALALSLGGLWVLAWRPAARWSLIAAGVLLTAAIYTRQSYALAAPLAAFVWLLAHQWRRALGLAALIGGLTLTLFLALNVLTRGGFYFNIVTANVNEFGVERLEYNLTRFYNAAYLLLYVGGTSLFLIRRWNPLWPLAAPYLLGAALSAATVGKIGSNVNYFLELCAALSLATGAVVAWGRRHIGIHVLQAVLLFALTLQAGQLIRTTFKEFVDSLAERRGRVDKLRSLEAIVAESQGPVLADEYMGLLTLQRRALVIQPFEVTQLAWAGLWDQTAFVQAIRDKSFSLILIHHFPDYPVYKERWTAEMLSAVDRAYVPTEFLADTVVYRPIGSETPTGACPGAPWRLPSDGLLGVQWKEGGLDFYDRGNEGAVPVYAVADGLLTRQSDWVDAVAIQHDDPLQLGQQVWSYYAGMGAANGTDSYVATEFPPGAEGIPVQAGQVLGYQGVWSGRPQWPMWLHAHFAVARGGPELPGQLTPETLMDPTPYLKLDIARAAEDANSQPLRCEK